jgi:hypothetical protein
MGYKPAIVADVQRRAGGAVTMLAKGVGIGAKRKPIAEYVRKPGASIGHYWYIPNVRQTKQFRHVLVDVNYWKRFVHQGLLTVAGDPGSISIFGKDAKQHELLAEHVARSEKWEEKPGVGGKVWEWTALPSHPDNHWFDCLVGCAAAASILGCRTPGAEAVPDRPVRGRTARSMSDMQAEAERKR